MRTHLEIWRQRWAMWVWPLAFLLLNVGLFFAHRLVVAVRVVALEAALEDNGEELAERTRERQQIEDLLARAEATREQLGELYSDRLGSEEERLTRVIGEVKRLARTAGFAPEVISYPEREIEEYGLVKKSLLFGVECSYSQLRQFITLLESSEYFLTLEQIGVSESGDMGSQLRIRFTLSTLLGSGPAVPPEAA